MPITVEHRDDLRQVYLFVFDNFSASVSEVADAHPTINTRYARELLGALANGQFVILTEDGEGSESYQAQPDRNTIPRAKAEAKIDKWLGVQPPPDPQNATSPSGGSRSSLKSEQAGAHPCHCGCGEVITSRSVYRPGHDARHAGVVGRAVAAIMEGGHDEGDQVEINRLYESLPTGVLRAKALRIADNANAKNLKKAQPEPTCVEGIVKIGKNERPARRWSGGAVEYLVPGQSEWKSASATAARTFQEG